MAPRRSETAHSDTQRNLISPLHCIQPDDLSSDILETLLVCHMEECIANLAMSVFIWVAGPNTNGNKRKH